MKTSAPFKVMNMMVGGPHHGENYATLGANTLIYAEMRPMRALCVHPDEKIDDGYVQHIYEYSMAMQCADQVMYRLYMYKGEK